MWHLHFLDGMGVYFKYFGGLNVSLQDFVVETTIYNCSQFYTTIVLFEGI